MIKNNVALYCSNGHELNVMKEDEVELKTGCAMAAYVCDVCHVRIEVVVSFDGVAK